MAQRTQTSPPATATRRGFTLIEILVVVAIIATLVAILIPALGGFRKHALIASANTRLGAIRDGLAQYFTDFGTYPPSASGLPSGTPYGNLPVGRGQAMLAQALVGYLAFDQDGAGPKLANGSVSPNPGDPVLGFRPRTGGFGKVFGPYVPTDSKTFRQNIVNTDNDDSFYDPFDTEIMYFLSTRSAPGSNLNGLTTIFGNNGNTCLFNELDCSKKADGTALPLLPSDPSNPAGFYHLFSASDSNNVAGAVTGSSSYLLISAGPDGKYFTADDIIMSK